MVLGAATVVLVLGGLAAGAILANRALPPRGQAALVVASVLAFPVGVMALTQVQHALVQRGPFDPLLAVPVALLPLVGFVALAVAPGRVAPRPRWWAGWAMGALVALVGFLVATNLAAGGTSTTSPRFLLQGVLLAVVAAVAPAAIAFALARQLWPKGLVAVPFLLLLVPMVATVWPAPLIALSEDASLSAAEHTWTIRLEPAGNQPYVVVLPLPRATGTSDAQAVTDLLVRLRVAEGQATFGFESGLLEVRGHGPAVVQARHVFYGPTGLREATADPSGNLTLLAGGPASLRVVEDLELSGGQGHTCWFRGHWEAMVQAGGSAPLQGEGQAVCA